MFFCFQFEMKFQIEQRPSLIRINSLRLQVVAVFVSFEDRIILNSRIAHRTPIFLNCDLIIENWHFPPFDDK